MASGEEIIKQGLMVKRSQNKKRFTPVNYKQRLFILTKQFLTYYDSDCERRKERGHVGLETVQVVESAQLSGDSAPSEGFPFQVGYRECGQEFTLFLVAGQEQERTEWLQAIRTVCCGAPSERYHVGLWTGKRWTCCRLSLRSAEGCDSCTAWGSIPETLNNNPLRVIGPPPVIPIMPGGTPGTPSVKTKEKVMIRPKVVVALYPFKAIEGGDLSLDKGAEYEVLDDSQEHWWKVKDVQG